MFDARGNLNLSGNASPEDISQNLVHDVANLAPLATQWHGPTTGVQISQIGAPAAFKAPSGFIHWLGGVGHEIGNLSTRLGGLVKNTLSDMVHAPVDFGKSISNAGLDIYDMHQHNAQNTQLSSQMDSLHNLYKSGSITASQFHNGLKDIAQQYNSLIKDELMTSGKFNQDSGQAVVSGIKVAADIVTVITSGFGAPAADVTVNAAARLLTSAGLDEILAPATAKLGELTVNKAMFDGLTTEAKVAMQKSVGEIVAKATPNMTANQIARASVVNLALKYPLYYSWAAGTGEDIYTKLDNKQYEGAVQQLAFNALLVLSGGPIGYSLKLLGKGAGAVKDATFGRSSFMDALSSGTGSGDVAGFYKEVVNPETPGDYKFWNESKQKFETKQGPELSKTIASNFSAVEKTNLTAVRGNNPVTAAWRVINGMSSYFGTTMRDVSHAEASVSMNNFAEAQRLASKTGRAAGLGQVTVGRVDYRSLQQVAKTVSQALSQGKSAALTAWEQMKITNPTWAYVHNSNFDRQIKALIDAHSNPDSLKAAITDIKAGFNVKGFPEAVAKELSSIGYVPIRPATLEAPFREGVGKIETQFARGEDFFIRAVQPLPVLGHVGTMFTKAGLSPEASSDRVYQMFNSLATDNFNRLGITGKIAQQMEDKAAASAAKKAESTSEVEGLTKDEVALAKRAGVTPEMLAKGSIEGEAPKPAAEAKKAVKSTQQTNDFAMKVLTNYAKNPTRHGVFNAAPITDFRMLSKADIIQAFKDRGIELNTSDARDVQEAVLHAYNQVPLFVRGLGDRAVDAAYSIPAVGTMFGRYLRLQGSLRFAWNPFFQYLRLIPKTEFLSSVEGGGWINSVFSGRLTQMGEVRSYLHDVGYFDKTGRMNVISGEAVDAVGLQGANLAKRLLPAQENSIAGLIDAQAQRLGMDWKEYIQAYPQNTRDTIQMIAEYDRRSSLLNSPLMRTLNIAFFPFRFEVKVATIMARNLAKTSLMTQVGVVNAMFKAHAWMNSPEGQAFYAQNADFIGLMEYISPLASLNQIFDSLLPGHDHSLGNFGELGGLPFGWITQLTDAEGWINFNQPGVDPKDGTLFQRYIPATARGQLAIGIQDFLSSLFSYPGSVVGAPSKSGITRAAALKITGAQKKTDLQLNTPALSDLSKQQQQYAATIQSLSNSTPTGAQPIIPYSTSAKPQPAMTGTPPQLLPSQQVPRLPTPAETPPKRKGTATKSGRTRRKKEKDYIPALLPGQDSFGEL